MKQFTFTIKDALGIHARPAGLLVKEAGRYESSIIVKKGEKEADVKKIFKLMSLGIRCGDEVEFFIDGSDEEEAATSIETVLVQNLG